MIEITLYSRTGCPLCDEARTELDALQSQIPHRLTVVDVDSSAELRQAYGEVVPVVKTGPYLLKAPFSTAELRMTLAAAQDRLSHQAAIDRAVEQSLGPQASLWTNADRFSYWFSRHYMAVFNLFILFYVGLPFLAPVLMEAGLPGPAAVIYRGYGMVCHQLAFRSFFLFGEQTVYPRLAAGVPGVVAFGQATGLSEGDSNDARWAARDFIGNRTVGYKVALCERDVAIYGAILLFGLVFALSGHSLPGLPWYLWMLVGLVPIGLDGFSQLLSQPPLSLLAYRESTPFLRSLTGFLFGFTTAWFGYPVVETTMAETRQVMADKWRRIQQKIKPAPE